MILGRGVGSLFAAWVAEVCERKQRPLAIELTAYEADSELAILLRQTVKACKDACRRAEIAFAAEIIEADFISETVKALSGSRLHSSKSFQFDCAILNPPYRKLNSQSNERRLLRSIGIETSNLYTAFLWLSFRLLRNDGELIAITPRSFCNGPYFRPFRDAFLREMTIRRIHVFESRKAAFHEADVLQENIIFRAVKSKRRSAATISSSAGPNDPDVFQRTVSQRELVNPADPNLVVHIVPDELGTRFAEQIRGFAATLEDLGIQVSTGRVVDFRARESLAYKANGKTVPLIYPVNFERGQVVWPKLGRKPNYLQLNPETKALVVPPGDYVLVKRFSAKEEKRRVMAAVCSSSRLPKSGYAFENHLNFFHKNGVGLPHLLAKGLAAYLNSTLVDSYFRQFSGHTQVNASDLRSLKYPDVGTLERLGSRIDGPFPNQQEIDKLLREETSMGGDDPANVKKRIDEAREILSSLGLPSAQQNERSALTLLALLDLKPESDWDKAASPMMGITPIMDWFAKHYGKRYAPNTRETVSWFSDKWNFRCAALAS